MEFVCGAAAASTAVTLTNPLEVIRTLFQLRHELQSGPVQPFNLLHHVRREGITSLQRGLSAALPYQFVMNGVRLGLFEWLSKSRGAFGVVSAGAVSGALGALLSSPFNLIKTRLQSATSTFKDAGDQHHYRSVLDAAKKIVRSKGILGLWDGAGASVLRTSVGSAVQLSSYTFCKRHLSTEYTIVPSATSSLFTIIAMNPFDVVMTRMYNQSGLRYSSVFDCFRQIVQCEGIKGLYKGFIPNYIRVGPHTILTLIFYENLKIIVKR
jgi:solute carrier family 25 protein 34/35